MNSAEITNVASVLSAEVQKPHLVVCADVSSYNSREQTIDCFEIVSVRAENEYAACDRARQALPEGGIPLVAFTHEGLQSLMAEMANCELKPGDAYNWTQRMTAAEIQMTYERKVDAGKEA